MEVKDLNKIGYVVRLRAAQHDHDLEYYFADHWPNPDLNQKYKQGYKVAVYNEVYYTTELCLAKVFNCPTAAQKAGKELREQTWADKPIWASAKAVPVTQEEVFKAKLKGPSTVDDAAMALTTRAKNMTKRIYGYDEIFEVME